MTALRVIDAITNNPLLQKLLRFSPDPQQNEQAQEFLIDTLMGMLRDVMKGHHNERRK